MALFNLSEFPPDVVAACSLMELIGEDEAEAFAMRAGGHSLRYIGEQQSISHVGAAKRLEVAEHKAAQVRERCERVMAEREARAGA